MAFPIKLGFVPANRRYFSIELASKMRIYPRSDKDAWL